MKRVGILIDGWEFIPQDIVDKHLPFAVPPGTLVESVFVETEDDQWNSPNGLWVGGFGCEQCIPLPSIASDGDVYETPCGHSWRFQAGPKPELPND